jgi:hyperosmotically inducible protein
MTTIRLFGLSLASAVLIAGIGCSPRDREEVRSSAQNTAADARQATENAANKAERVIEDSVITAKVKSALLSDASVKGLAIEVETQRGTVTLSGNAKSESERMRAESLATGIEGVRSVVNRISVS